jgi:hypothetical protein
MGLLTVDITMFKDGVRRWLAKTAIVGERQIHGPLVRLPMLAKARPGELSRFPNLNQLPNPAAAVEGDALRAYADVQARIHALKGLIAWLQRAVAIADSNCRVMPVTNTGGRVGDQIGVTLVPLDTKKPAPPLDVAETPYGLLESRGTSIPRPDTVSRHHPQYAHLWHDGVTQKGC